MSKEVQEERGKLWREIAAAVEKIVESHMVSMIFALQKEFGRAQLRDANLSEIEDILFSLGLAAAEKGQFLTEDVHYERSQQATSNMVNAAFSALKLAKSADASEE